MGKKSKKRGYGRYILIPICILGVLFSLGYAGYHHFRDHEIFKVKHVQIRGNELLDTKYLYSIAEAFKGINYFDIDQSDIESRFIANSRIEKVDITKKILQRKVIITVMERKGVFHIIDSVGNYIPIDKERYVLDKADRYLAEDLPLINIKIDKNQLVTGNKIDDNRIEHIFDVFDTILEKDKALIADISEFNYKNGELNFIDNKNGCRIILSNANLKDQIGRFIFIRAHQPFLRNSVIDLRFDGQVVVS
ncbi:MAG: FtsQ-type POTRA domain-containing protein [Candidatus Cloacimonetes bacterium]|nr:FtsQ-type POTRA domain-containing protein [Candidatus Cloacimonadota bacterium]